VQELLLPRTQLGDRAGDLLLAAGQLVHALSQAGERGRYLLELLQLLLQLRQILLELSQLGRGRSLRGSSESGLRDGRRLRCQRGKLRQRGGDHRSGCIAIPLPDQSGTDTDLPMLESLVAVLHEMLPLDAICVLAIVRQSC